jgi:3-oxoacyl-[acyl-carrier-protein] synthase II
MSTKSSVVITGLGVVCPLGIGRAAVAESLAAARGGIRGITEFELVGLPMKTAGIVENFDPLEFVKPRKTLKVLARDSQLALAAASLARDDSRLTVEAIDPERFGVVMGAEVIRNALAEVAEPFRACIENDEYDFARWGEKGLRVCFPLGMLKLLPNMPACHISIAHDARGPNNSICLRETSSLSAISEARRALERGAADAMMVGGTSSRVNAYDILRYGDLEELSSCDDPERACRPFDTARDGQVLGEGAAVLMLERRDFARRREATVLAEIRGCGAACEPGRPGSPLRGTAVRQAVAHALAEAGLEPADIGFVSAHGLGLRRGDAIEAAALAEVLPGCPVFAPKSYIGNLGGACGAVEAAIAVLNLQSGIVPPTIHCENPDPECPITIIRGRPQRLTTRRCVVVNYTSSGQAAALVLQGS